MRRVLILCLMVNKRRREANHIKIIYGISDCDTHRTRNDDVYFVLHTYNVPQ